MAVGDRKAEGGGGSECGEVSAWEDVGRDREGVAGLGEARTV